MVRSAMVTCQVCGNENPPGVEYCEDCGASLAAQATPVTSPESTTGAELAPGDDAETGKGVPPELAVPVTDTEMAPDPNLPSEPLPPVTESELATEGTVPDEAAPQSGTTPEGAAPAEPVPGAESEPIPMPAGAPVGTQTTPDVGEAPAPTATGTPRLVAKRHGVETGDQILLQGDRLVVGRFDPETGPVDIDLSEAPEAPQISRHHAELYRESDGQWYVKDLGSTNGVFVKGPDSSTFGPRITTPTVVPPGGEVAFANARFIYRQD